MALILHAITFLCCANWLFGVAGIVFAVRAGHARDRGRPEQAETLTRYSWYCLGAAGVMVFVMLILSLVMLTQAGSWIEGIVGVQQW
jgi:putative copper export protein